MGHKRYGHLPRTRKWKSILAELGNFVLGEADVGSIAQKTLQNVQGKYSKLQNDPSINSSLEYLLHLSIAFRQNNPLDYLNTNQMMDGNELSLLKLAKGASKYRADEIASHEYKVFAKQALVDTINTWYRKNKDSGHTLFSDKVDVNFVFSKAGSANGFTDLSRIYFSKLTERYLKYFLEREASSKISNIYDRDRFSEKISEDRKSVV